MFEDLRGYLTHLESQGQLLRVAEPVDVKYEIAAGVRKTSDIEGPALLFEQVKGFPGWRVLGGLFATRRRRPGAGWTEQPKEGDAGGSNACDASDGGRLGPL